MLSLFDMPMFLSLPGHTEWLIILVVVLLIFGPKNLPKLGSALGGFARNLKAGKNDEQLEEDEEFEDKQPTTKKRRHEE